jgi:DNA-binding NtrC family response regulator
MTNNKPVLMIGGDGVDLAGYRTSLRAVGIGQVVCADGQEMESLLSVIDPALVILDFDPSVNPGEKLLQDIRAGFPHVPLVVITGVRDPEIQDRCIAAGAAGYLFKPVQPERLAATAMWALEQAGVPENEASG